MHINSPIEAHELIHFSLSTGSAVCLTGRWQASPNDKVQSHELHVQDVRLIGEAEAAVSKLWAFILTLNKANGFY